MKLDNSKKSDREMLQIYDYIYKQIISCKNDMELVRGKVYKFEDNSEYINFLIDDVENIINSLDYLELSCECALSGEEDSFFTFTTFYRSIIVSMIIISGKIHKVVNNINLDRDVLHAYYRIKSYIECELKEWRNEIEHDIDPFYNGDVYNIIRNLTLRKVIRFINEVNYIIDSLSISKFNITSYKKFDIHYNVTPLEERKEMISKVKETYLKLSEMVIELSFISEEKGLTIEERNIFDLGLKLLELNKALKYIDQYRNMLGKDYEDITKSFIRAGIIINYEIFDKLGYYFNIEYTLELPYKKTYFKEAIKKIRDNQAEYSELIKSSCLLCDNEAYKQLSKIRQCIIHDKGIIIDYNRDKEIIYSLIRINFIEVQNIVYIIFKEYFKKKGYSVFQKAKDELNIKLQ